MEKGDRDRVVPGNFTEWRNNVSYATFPEWRAVGGWGSLQILTARERKNESAIERVKIVGKRVEMQSLSGMQLGARHRPGKGPSCSVFLLEFFSFPPSLRPVSLCPSLSFLLLPFVRLYIRTQIFSLARFLIIHVSASRHTNTHHHSARITTIGNIRDP